MKNSVKLIFVSALLLTAASCAKDARPGASGEDPVRFDVGVYGTKATLINAATDNTFKTDGFAVIAYEGSTKKMDKVGVTYSETTETWTCSEEYLWKKDTEMRFFGYYPQALAGSLTTSNTGISAFTYSPLENGGKNVNGQEDYMLATYNGTGNEGKAPLDFTHPLSSVAFKVGTFDSSVTEIKSIAIGGFYTTATCTPTAGTTGLTYAWSGRSGSAEDGSIEQSGLSVNLTETNPAIGEPFVLIPGQKFTALQPLTVLLTVAIDNETQQLFATIVGNGTDDDLVQGYTTTYTINYEPAKGLQFDEPVVTPWGSGVSGTPVLTDFGALPGKFTINDNGDQVQFSKGNLQFRATADGTGTDLTHKTLDGTKQGIWRFAEEQWDFIGEANANASATYTGWIDLFVNGTSGCDAGWAPWAIPPENQKDLVFVNTNYDWGWYNAISNGGDTPGIWHCLTKDEMDYIVDSRPKPANTGTNIGFLKVLNNFGLVIYPDGFEYPSELAERGLYPYNATSKTGSVPYDNVPNFSVDDFSVLERLGVVFLPAAGAYDTTRFTFNFMVPNSDGGYAVQLSSRTKALGIGLTLAPLVWGFPNPRLYPNNGDSNIIYSVRLVTDAN